MFLRFSVENYLSIRDKQELSFVTSSLKGREEGLIECDISPTKSVLPSLLIYGANASGKSNIVQAFREVQNMILYSHSKGQPGEGIPQYSPFKLDVACADIPTEFEVDFVLLGTRYVYGFQFNQSEFVAEWLYSFPKGKRRVLFERNGEEFIFGRFLKGRNKIISELTRDNSLFLSAASQNRHETLQEISKYFKAMYGNISIHVPSEYASHHLSRRDLDTRVVPFLSNIGSGVVGSRVKEIQLTDEDVERNSKLLSFLKEMSSETRKLDLEIPKKITELQLSHLNSSGEDIFFDLDRESEGTRRLLMVLPEIFRALDNGSLMVVDELDVSLHTRAGEALLGLFCSKKSNPNGAQLFATTHDTNLLQSKYLRRDQIWFTEKDQYGATDLFPLTDINTRETDNIENGYLQGRYGAIPLGLEMNSDIWES